MRAVAGSGAVSREELLAILKTEVGYWEGSLGVESQDLEEMMDDGGRKKENVEEVLKSWSWEGFQK